MGCNNSKVKGEEKEPPSLSEQYTDVIPFESVGGDFSGDCTTFYEDIGDVEKSIPFLKSHPELEITVEVYLECPKECTPQRCGQCTTDQCNNLSIAEEQAVTIESILKNNDCSTVVNRKFWGCRDENIKKDIIKISISKKEEEKKEDVVVPFVPEPITVVDTNKVDEENAKREAAFAQREAAMLAAEKLLAKQLAAAAKSNGEAAAEKKRLQAVKEEQEAARVANEAALQELEQKRIELEKARDNGDTTAAAATKALEEENAKRDATLAQREAALAATEALLAKQLAEVDKDRDEVAREKQRLLATKQQLQTVQDEQEEVRVANETAVQEAERRRVAFEKAQQIAEAKAKEAEVALQAADKKKREYEVALAAVEHEREAEREKVRGIMYEIEETLKEEIEFVQNKAELSDQGKHICDKVLPFLLKLPDMKINIESHTNCKKGKCDHGCHLMDLSQERVDTVRSYFLERGASNEFHTKGWGCRHPELKNVRKVRIYPDHSHHEVVHVPPQ